MPRLGSLQVRTTTLDGQARALEAAGRRRWHAPFAVAIAVVASALVDAPVDAAAQPADVHFLITGDPQYFEDPTNDRAAGVGPRADDTLNAMVGLTRSDHSIRGMVIAGDLTQNTRHSEFRRYLRHIRDVPGKVYDGVGNHDVDPAKRACGRESGGNVWSREAWMAEADSSYDPGCYDRRVILEHVARTGPMFGSDDWQRETPTNQCDEKIEPTDFHDDNKAFFTNRDLYPCPHYSWDWEDIHFVQLNIYPYWGNEPTGDATRRGPGALFALNWLTKDLARSVGESGRPVVLIHHYDFSEVQWWPEWQREAYWDVITNYNVAAIFGAHSEPGPNDPWQPVFGQPANRSTAPYFDHLKCNKQKLDSSSGTWVTMAVPCIPSYTAGSAKGVYTGNTNPIWRGDVYQWQTPGTFLDVRIVNNQMTIKRFKVDGESVVQIGSPVTQSLARRRPHVPADLTFHDAITGAPVVDGDVLTEFTPAWTISWPQGVPPHLPVAWVAGVFRKDAPGCHWPCETEVRQWAHSSDPFRCVLGPSWDPYHPCAGPPDDKRVTISEEGDYVVRVLVQDGLRRYGWDKLPHAGFEPPRAFRFTIERPPTADAGGPYEALEGDAVDLDGTASSDPGEDALTFVWDLDGDGDFDDATGHSPSFAWGDEGTYAVGLKVTDVSGLSDTDTAVATVRNAAPTVSELGADAPKGEGADVSVTGLVRDPGWLDALSATISWGDGTAREPLLGTTENEPPDAERRFSASHAYGDQGVYNVEVCAEDGDHAATCRTTDVRITNVVPSVAVERDQPMLINEGDVFNVNARFADPGWLDSYTSLIEWGTGESSTGELTVTDPGPPSDRGVVTGSNQYGDDGSFAAGVRVADDDGGTGADWVTVTVVNVAPTAELDRRVTTAINGSSVFFGHAGTSLDFAARSQDPGSDDLLATWDFSDGTPTVSTSHLANPPLRDGTRSPDVGARDIVDASAHAFTEPCRYEVTFRSDDDDGAAASDRETVMITGNVADTFGAGYWKRHLDTAASRARERQRMACRLSITDGLSRVLSELRDVSTVERARALLGDPPRGDMARIFDRQLLTTWLNFANGALDPDELVDTDGNGVADTAFADVVSRAEDVRRDPDATRAQLEQQKSLLEHMNER